jgi:hypothetical protein
MISAVYLLANTVFARQGTLMGSKFARYICPPLLPLRARRNTHPFRVSVGRGSSGSVGAPVGARALSCCCGP